jgi:hypothetical protein
VLAAVAALGACGSGDGSEPSGAAPAASHLRIEVRANPDAETEVATLDCPAEPRSSGFITDAQRACRVVEDNRDLLLHGPPDNIMCTQQYGGPQKATISGTVDGKPVRLAVSREDGCAIATWDALEPILGPS